ncbi:MAG: FAD-dependent oxidoreductase [Leptothrix sp. (in: b-proteobacteria)]
MNMQNQVLQGSSRAPTGLSIGIAGAGVLGRLAAWALASAGHRVTVFDPASSPAPRQDGLGPAGYTAAGMLSPLAELDNASPEVALLGWQSLGLWRQVTQALQAAAGSGDAMGNDSATASAATGAAPAGPLFRQLGSLLLAHGSDLGAAERVLARLRGAPTLHSAMPAPQALDRAELGTLEPALDPQLRAWLLPGEGQVLPAPMLSALAAQAPGVDWRWSCSAAEVAPGRITLADGRQHDCDWALDLRGLGARPALPLRGVRGEVVWLHAPGVALQRPIRLLHPRHRVYVVPRPGDLFVVGASEIESEDRSPVSLRSGVELMAAAHSVLPGLAEARIVHLETNLRPALPDNEPRIDVEPGLLRINGLFRHGWLLAPALLVQGLARCELTHALRADPVSFGPPANTAAPS